MRRLPALVAGSQSWGLPIADRSAATLVEGLLVAPSPSGPDRRVDQLILDPPLILWTACRAWQTAGFRPSGARQLADWLLENAASTIRWDERESRRFQSLPAEKPDDRFVQQIVSDLVAGETAARLAQDDSPQVREQAHLLGLLSGARRWLELASGGSVSDAGATLPPWLTTPEKTAAGRAAAALARATAAPDAGEPDAEWRECRDWALENAHAWCRERAGLPALLPPLAEKLDRLAQLERQFHQTLETEKLESLAEFAAGAGHEINNPLAIIGGRAQLLLRDEPSRERQRELAMIVAQVRRANEMIADIRLFSRPPEPEFQPVDLSELVDRVLAEAAEQAAERAIALVRSGDREALRIEADPNQIGIAIHALCRNAIEAIGRNGMVDVSLRRTPLGAEVLVADDGPGIKPEERRHLFDPFYSARQAGRGLGFGLSKAWRIVTGHGGSIEVESEPGEGAVFVIKLPRTVAAQRA